MKLLKYFLLIVFLGFLTACESSSNSQDELSGTLLIWHTWPEPDSAILIELLNSFMDVNPGVKVVSEYVPANELRDRYLEQIDSGLGPDVMIGADLNLISDLAKAGHLEDLNMYNLEVESLLPQAIDALYIEDALYGLPFAVNTNVLYYNKEIINQPPATLLELLEAAQAGHQIGIPTDFKNAYWGIRAFGGHVLSQNGDIVVDEGFIRWLNWLLHANEQSTVILNNNYDDLRQSFLNHEIAFLVGQSIDLPLIQETMTPELLGVALLPGVQDQPGSLLNLEVLTISRVSAEEKLAVKLIEFMTNRIHQRVLALSGLGQIPVNRHVIIDSRLAPTAAILREQSEYAVIIPLAHVQIEATLNEAGTDIYTQVLAGVLTPEEAARQLSRQANSQRLLPDDQ